MNTHTQVNRDQKGNFTRRWRRRSRSARAPVRRARRSDVGQDRRGG